MRYLTINELLALHRMIMMQAGAEAIVLNAGALEAALAAPRMTFEGDELYPLVADKAAALAYALILNHPFLDGNKRTGHAAMEVFLLLNGHELAAPVDEQERVLLQVAAGVLRRNQFTDWVRARFEAAVTGDVNYPKCAGPLHAPAGDDGRASRAGDRHGRRIAAGPGVRAALARRPGACRPKRVFGLRLRVCRPGPGA